MMESNKQKTLALSTFDSYYVFGNKEKNYLFDIYNMEYVEIDGNIFCALSEKKLDKLSDSEIELLEELCNKGYFFHHQKPELSSIRRNKIYISLAPVTKCNLRCKYCFASYGNNNESEIKQFDNRTISQICDYFLHNYEEVNDFRVDFVSGGEPLLDLDLTEMILSILTEKFSEKKLEIFLCTNGTLLNDNACALLNKYNVNLGVSADGEKEIHDRCRVYQNGFGTYEDVYKNISALKCNENISKNLKSAWSLSVVTANTKSLVELIKHNKYKGFAGIQMKLVRLSKEDSLAISEDKLLQMYSMIDELLLYFKESIQNSSLDDILFFLNDNDYFGKLIRRVILKERYVYRCHAGREKYAVTPNGNLYPCDSFVGTKEYILGNVFTGQKPRRAFEEYDVDRRGRCASCWCRYVCGGDCFHNSLMVNNSVVDCDEIYCKLAKYTIEQTIIILNDLEKENSGSLRQLEHILRVRFSLNRV